MFGKIKAMYDETKSKSKIEQTRELIKSGDIPNVGRLADKLIQHTKAIKKLESDIDKDRV